MHARIQNFFSGGVQIPRRGLTENFIMAKINNLAILGVGGPDPLSSPPPLDLPMLWYSATLSFNSFVLFPIIKCNKMNIQIFDDEIYKTVPNGVLQPLISLIYSY